MRNNNDAKRPNDGGEMTMSMPLPLLLPLAVAMPSPMLAMMRKFAEMSGNRENVVTFTGEGRVAKAVY